MTASSQKIFTSIKFVKQQDTAEGILKLQESPLIEWQIFCFTSALYRQKNTIMCGLKLRHENGR
jgi:hypothetical protein